MNQQHSSLTIQVGFLCQHYKGVNICKKIGARKSLQQSLLRRTLLYPRVTVINGLLHCTHSLFFPTVYPGLLSVVQRFNRNRRVQPYPAEFTALHLWKQHSDIRICISENEGIQSRVSQKLSLRFLWHKRNLTVLYPLLYQRRADLPYFMWMQSHTRWALSKTAYQSPSWDMDKETFSVQDWWLAPAGISHCHGLRTFLWSSETELQVFQKL